MSLAASVTEQRHLQIVIKSPAAILFIYKILLYNYDFHPIKNTHLRHVTVHYFSVLYNQKRIFSVLDVPINPYCFRIVHYIREVTR